MLGFAYANPNLAVMIQKYKLYVSELIKNDSPAELEAVGKFIKRSADDPRRKVLWIAGIQTLRRVQQEYPAEKLGDVLIGVFDAGDKLMKDPNIKIVDAELEAKTEADRVHQTWKMHQFDLESVMRDAAGGYELPKPGKIVTPDAPVKLTPVTSRRGPPADSLPKLFDPMLASISTEKNRRAKVAGWIAAKIEGVLDKESWAKSMELVDKWGGSSELIKGAWRAYRDAGHLATSKAAVKAIVVEGLDVEIAAQVHSARQFDLEWLNANWPFENLSAEMFGA